jgi:hypothetical protein
MFGEMVSGVLESAMPASTKPQFATGPQKCDVLGPVSEFQNSRSLLPNEAVARDAMMDAGLTGLPPSTVPWYLEFKTPKCAISAMPCVSSKNAAQATFVAEWV